ncbi:hypothetical protein CHUAL_013201 [Chamberlinius hualienensis]
MLSLEMASIRRGIVNGMLMRNKLIHLQKNVFSSTLLCATRNFNTSNSSLGSFNVQDKDDFNKRVLENPVPVIVDFYAAWCGPCKTLGPRLESVIDTYGDQVDFAKVNIDDNTELAMEYDVDAVPCVIGFRGKQQIDKFTGLRETDVIKSFVDKVIGPKS